MRFILGALQAARISGSNKSRGAVPHLCGKGTFESRALVRKYPGLSIYQPWQPKLKVSGTGHSKLNSAPAECFTPFSLHVRCDSLTSLLTRPNAVSNTGESQRWFSNFEGSWLSLMAGVPVAAV